jgi:putative selenium metabolism protein SsnA
MATVIANGTLLNILPREVRRANLLIEEGRISAVIEDLPDGDHQVFDASNMFVMPGNACGHTHLYSALARGMPPPPKNPRNFPEILEYIWWRLDRALDEPSIRSSAALGAIDALKAGTTTLIDHHASPNCIEGSLDMLAEELSGVGVRGVLCYEVTDRNGLDGRQRGLAENERFARGVSGRWPLMRALIGGHASFTLDDDALDAICAISRNLGIGVHIHAAEDVCDEEDSMRRSGVRVAHRLERHGILGARTLLAHGVHLDEDEIVVLEERNSWLAHNCRSNLNNSVGRAPFAQLVRRLGGRIVLGTDGIDQDMFAESRTAFFRAREDSLNATADQVTDSLAAGGHLATECFGIPVGRLSNGAAADLVVLDYNPPTPISPDNVAWHWAFAFDAGLVRDVMVDGQWRVRDRHLTMVDEERVRAVARDQAHELWERMAELPV